MAGLMDMFDDPQLQLGLGLLAAAAPRADAAGFGQRLAEGFNSLGAWKKQKQQAEYAQALLDEHKAKAAQEQAALQAAKDKRDFLPQLWQSPANAGVMQIDEAGNPVALSSQPTKQVLNVKGALAKGYTPEELAKIDGLRNIGMDKVARTITFQGNDGKEYEQQVDDFGRPVGEKVLKFRAPIMQELGGKVDALDPYSLQPKASFQKTMTFADKNAAANLDLSRQRFAFDQRGGADANKWTFNADAGGWIKPPSANAPAGSVIKMDGMSPKLTEDQAKASGWLVQANNAYSNMVKAMNNEKGVEGVGGADLVAAVPGMSGVGNWMRSTDRQKFVQASSSLSEALLRAATGAGVNKDEAQQKIAELTPVFGDDPETRQQKMNAIPLYLESLRMRAGPGAKNAEAVLQKPAAQQPTQEPVGNVDWQFVNGKLVKVKR